MDEKKIQKYAVDYLSKYDSSKKNLSDVIKRKIFRLNISGQEKRKLINHIDRVLSNLEKNNLLNDQRYCNSKIASLSIRGKSRSFIFNYLLKKGIDKFEIQDNLNLFENNNNNWELNSAKIFAKKKNIIKSKDSYEKKLAKIARAGFSYEICKKILN